MPEYNHIEIAREEAIRPYRFHPNRNAPRPPIRNRREHGNKLNVQLASSLQEIVTKKKKLRNSVRKPNCVRVDE